MKGFLRIPAAEFEAWNVVATADYIDATGDNTCTDYTFAKPDADAAFVWGRVEHDFIVGDIKTEAEAVNLGMVVPDDDAQAEI